MTTNGVTRGTPVAALAELVTVAEAAAWLGISRGLVRAMVERGELQAARLGRLVRIQRASLAALAGVEVRDGD